MHLLYNDRLADLRLHCRYHETGCESVLCIKDFRNHVASCSYSPQPCAFPGCTERLTALTLIDHVSVCGHRPIECELGCGNRIPIRSKDDHVANSCPNADVTCTYGCGMVMKRSVYASHTSGTCTKAPVTCCVPGCTATVLREEVEQHHTASLAHHFALMAGAVSSLSCELTEAKRHLRNLKSHVWGRAQPSTLHSHTDSTSTLAVSGDQRTLYCGSDDGAIRAWDISNRRISHRITIPGGSRLNAVWTLLVCGQCLVLHCIACFLLLTGLDA